MCVNFSLDTSLYSLQKTAKISSSTRKRILEQRSQYKYWQHCACMISILKSKTIYPQRQNLFPKKLQFCNRAKCSKRIVTYIQNLLVGNSTLLSYNKYTTSWLWLMSTERSPTSFIGTRCQNL